MHSKILEELRPRPYCVTHRHQAAMGDPVGDPFGGPAYGEKNGPAIALVGAGLSISGGMAIMGTSALMGGLMIAGGVMSGLGALTGNKTLSTLGMVTGLAGGVGQFFKTGGFDSFSMANQADGAQGMANQFTGDVDYSYGFPGNDVPALDPASQALQDAGNASRTQEILRSETGGFGNDGGFGVDVIDGAAERAAATASGPSSGVNIPVPGAGGGTPAADLAKAKKGGLLGLWEGSGDFTKYALINAASGAVGGMNEAENNEKLIGLKERQLANEEKVSAAQVAAIDKKNAGVQTVGIGSFGANRSKAFGTNADGGARSYAEYIADRTGAMQRLFGTQQTAPA